METKLSFILFLLLAVFLAGCNQEIWHTAGTYGYTDGWDEVKTSQFEIKGKMWKVSYTLQHAEYGCVTYAHIQKKCMEFTSELSKGLPAGLNVFVYKEDKDSFKLAESHDFAHNQNEIASGSFTVEGKGTYYIAIKHSNALSTITVEDYY
ncbi:MAG: hypothetical protein AABX63_01265 [Nanoarchaeota archaeon]